MVEINGTVKIVNLPVFIKNKELRNEKQLGREARVFRDLFFSPLRQHSWWSLASRCPVFCPATNSYFIFSSPGKGHLEPHVPPLALPCLYIFRDQLLSLTSLQIILLTCSSFQSWGNAFSRSCACINHTKPLNDPLSTSGGASGKEPACQRRRHKRHGVHPWVRKIR